MSDREYVRLEIDGRVAVLSLNRPRVLNAIDDRVCDGLLAQLDVIERNDSVSVVILAGEGRAFSAGADLKFMRTLAGERLRRFIEKTWVVGERIARLPMVTIAAVQGYAFGGGAELALACDMRLVEDTALIAFPEMTLGSVPGSGAMQRLPSLIGPSRALELVVEGRRVDGREAHAIGLANKLVSDGEAVKAARTWADTLAQRPIDAVRYAKMCLRLPADGAIAPMVHGLVSGACQSAASYRDNTQRFAKATESA